MVEFIWNKYYLEKKNDRVLPGPVGAVPPATQRMISWLINFIIYLRVHIISYLPQVGQIISYLPTQNKYYLLRVQIISYLPTQK